MMVESRWATNPPANLQTLPSGSYVIAMDNTLQGTGNLGTYAKFNMKTYGLIVHLLNNNIKLKWVISAGKVKDAIDFTVNAELVKPTFVTAVSRNFKAGPFVIYPSDTIGLSSLINSYYTNQGLTGNNRPNIFRTTASVTVDIRYSYDGFKPRAAILTDGGNQNIHRDYFIEAGISALNYSILGAINLDSCFSFASEPHNSKSGAVVDATVINIKNFVNSGRNFLAQCHAITTYENNVNGKFQTTNGITDVNNSLGISVTVPNADLAFYQYEGAYHASDGGSVKNWRINAGGNVNSNLTKIKGNGQDTITFGATMTKTGTGLGGIVFYIGNHSFDVSNEQNISGMRMYMNAFLMPAQLPSTCGSRVPLPVKLTSFQGNMINNKVNLQWAVAENENSDKFELQKSTDGINFNTAALVFSSEKAGTENYTYAEKMSTDKIFYRLRMIDKAERVNYSNILMFQSTAITFSDNGIRIMNNPANEYLSFSFQLKNNQPAEVKIIDLTGRVQMKQILMGSHGTNNFNLQLNGALQKGMYILEVTAGADRFTEKFIKQ